MREVDKLARDIRWLWAVFAIFIVIAWVFPRKDDTDPANGHSGMELLTDAGTGCQYLSKWGLTPRLDASGKQIGCRR